MRSVLVIAYYFPPMGFSGVQRTLKFVKYLPEFGYRPTVLTVQPHPYFAFDDSLLDELKDGDVEILRADSAGIFAVGKGRSTVALKNERLRKILNRVSQAFFIPDNKIGWKKNALELVSQSNPERFDIVFSTAPPFTDHLVGLELKRRYGLPLVLDFRDAWLENPYHFYWTPFHKARAAALEKSSVAGADAVVAASSYVTRALQSRYANGHGDSRFHVIPHGYDAQDFQHAITEGIPAHAEDELRFVYSGIFYEDHTPIDLYHALVWLKQQRPALYKRLRFYMVGYVQDQYRLAAQKLGVDDRFVYVGYLPHNQVTGWLLSADVVWFVIGPKASNLTVSSGKVFEYIGSGKPILGIVPQNDIRNILGEFPNAWLVMPGDTAALGIAIERIAGLHSAGALPVADPVLTGKYDRHALTGDLARLMDSLCREK